jgi:hypothetical protein
MGIVPVFVKAACGRCGVLCAIKQLVYRHPTLARCPAMRTDVRYLLQDKLTVSREGNFVERPYSTPHTKFVHILSVI